MVPWPCRVFALHDPRSSSLGTLLLVAVALLAGLVAYIESRQVQVDWGSALGGIRLDLATSAMLNLAHERKHSSNWRPQLLCLPGWPMNPEPAPANRAPPGAESQQASSFRERVGLSFIGGGMKVTSTQPPKQRVDPRDSLLKLATQLKKGRGLCVVAEVEEGDLGRDRGLSTRVSNARDNLERRLQDAGVEGFRARCRRRELAGRVGAADSGSRFRRVGAQHRDARLAATKPR